MYRADRSHSFSFSWCCSSSLERALEFLAITRFVWASVEGCTAKTSSSTVRRSRKIMRVVYTPDKHQGEMYISWRNKNSLLHIAKHLPVAAVFYLPWHCSLLLLLMLLLSHFRQAYSESSKNCRLFTLAGIWWEIFCFLQCYRNLPWFANRKIFIS